MKMSGLLSAVTLRDRRELPGLSGTARVDRHTESLLRRVSPGEIAVIDQIDLDRVTADGLIASGVAAVINASPSISGRFPNLGPAALISAGITLVDGIGDETLRRLRDGSRIRLHDGAVFLGDELVGRGVPQTEESVAEAMHHAKEGLANQLEAFSANTIEFMRRDRALLLDGVGVPDVRVPLRGHHVLVVAGGSDLAADLVALRRYIKEYHPVLVGVEGGADALWQAGHRPDLLVGDPAEISDDVLVSGADVVVPAFADGHAPGLHRVQDLGTGAVTFPASANPEDLALLLAHHHGASLIVTVGFQATLGEFLDRGRSSSNASTFLTRLKVGNLLVDGKAVAALYRSPVSAGAVLVLVGAVLIATFAALMVTSAGPAIIGYLERAVSSLVEFVQGWMA
ncbi:putative cytokinetic ring protein SteA [Pseudonocardia spinosispora]|uniref:putative cytokinetic ring protein SteA n=1 Tax=Pseudonocardia spinosispora TaxID=103441 RepID=UPI0004905C2E|nr:putative cytokinetic ring protein SteA [Pseudonocardia spinosispora]